MKNQNNYPSTVNRTCLISEIGNFTDFNKIYLCGRLTYLDREKKTGQLRDWSGSIQLTFSVDDDNLTELNQGDIVQLNGILNDVIFSASDFKILVPLNNQKRISSSSQESKWNQLLNNQKQFELIKFRSDFLQTVRQFFLEQGFIEIDAPSLVPTAGMEPHIEPFVSKYISKSSKSKNYFLHTSPELALKKMLVAGYEKIFYLGHVFRNGELAPLHNPEFTMLEWYRTYSDYTSLMKDCENLVNFVKDKLSAKWAEVWQKDDLLNQSWEIISLAKLMKVYCQFDLSEIGKNDASKLLKIVHSKGLTSADETWSLDDLFFLLFLEFVEPNLGVKNPIIVKDYPIWMASLAKKKQNDLKFVERFELYIDAIELANAFTELNDPDEQYQRLLNEQEQREKLNRSQIPIDMDFIKALQTGMPPSAGIALGVDRLMMVCTNQKQINHVLPYSF